MPGKQKTPSCCPPAIHSVVRVMVTQLRREQSTSTIKYQSAPSPLTGVLSALSCSRGSCRRRRSGKCTHGKTHTPRSDWGRSEGQGPLNRQRPPPLCNVIRFFLSEGAQPYFSLTLEHRGAQITCWLHGKPGKQTTFTLLVVFETPQKDIYLAGPVIGRTGERQRTSLHQQESLWYRQESE